MGFLLPKEEKFLRPKQETIFGVGYKQHKLVWEELDQHYYAFLAFATLDPGQEGVIQDHNFFDIPKQPLSMVEFMRHLENLRKEGNQLRSDDRRIW